MAKGNGARECTHKGKRGLNLPDSTVLACFVERLLIRLYSNLRQVLINVGIYSA